MTGNMYRPPRSTTCIFADGTDKKSFTKWYIVDQDILLLLHVHNSKSVQWLMAHINHLFCRIKRWSLTMSKLTTQSRISLFSYWATFYMLFYILGMSDSLFYLDGGIGRQFKPRLWQATMNEQWPDLYVRYQSSMTPAIWLCVECTTLGKGLQLSILHL